MGFYATDTLEPAPPSRMDPGRARLHPACGRKPLRGPIHNAISGYRFYNPGLGRWVNRDPIDELGFNVLLESVVEDLNDLMASHFEARSGTSGQRDPLYVFVLNNPVSFFDVLGLTTEENPCEKCGPDITEPLKQVISKVRSDFAGWSRYKRWSKCAGLKSPLTAPTAWDVKELSPSQRGKLNTAFPGCPTKKCWDTVEVDGGCYLASRANYVLFGTQGDLCGWSLADTLFLVEIWKRLAYRRDADPDTVGWTTSGWIGWPSAAAPPTQPERKQCTLTCGSVPGPFDYIWSTITGRGRR